MNTTTKALVELGMRALTSELELEKLRKASLPKPITDALAQCAHVLADAAVYGLFSGKIKEEAEAAIDAWTTARADISVSEKPSSWPELSILDQIEGGTFINVADYMQARHCVNTYDALVEALEKIEGGWTPSSIDEDNPTIGELETMAAEQQQIARVALTLAKQETT